MNQMCVNNIFANDKGNGYECIASIDNYSSLAKKIAIGESVTSNEFAMLFPNSVGESKWRLVFYPRGQYVDAKVGDSIGIYLIMLSCEDCKTLKANVEFKLVSEGDADANGPSKQVNTIFNYTIPSKRWTGEPNFFRKCWWTVNRRQQFCCNDCLIIRCLVEEVEPEITEVIDPLMELEFTTENVATDDKGNGNHNLLQNGHDCPDDRQNDGNNDGGDWSDVPRCKKSNKRQHRNQGQNKSKWIKRNREGCKKK